MSRNGSSGKKPRTRRKLSDRETANVKRKGRATRTVARKSASGARRKPNAAATRSIPASHAVNPAEYVKQVPSASNEFAQARPLSVALAGMKDVLSRKERGLIVRQALLLIEQNYAHLPLKRAMHAIDPVQRLKLLQQELDDAQLELDSDLAFHAELTNIFTSLRDLHTVYLLPRPYDDLTAFLPFMLEECFVPGKKGPVRKYIVSHVNEKFEHESFVEGVEILYWNGVPIDRAVRNNAQRFAGSNAAARRARGIETMTARVLRVEAPPDEEWVIVGYRTAAGAKREVRLDWVVSSLQAMSDVTPESATKAFAAVAGVDLHQQLVQRVRASLFGRTAKVKSVEVLEKMALGEKLGPLESEIPGVLEASTIKTTSGTFGYVRIRTFNIDPVTMVNEFARLVSALPRTGLVIDVRGNGGGVIHSGEFLLQLLTPNEIEPEPVQFINSSTNLKLCEANGPTSQFADLTPWRDSMKLALRTGATFSAGFPLSPKEGCNAVGQRYFGPVVLITDALCYSTTDIFAAGFQDHDIGVILGTSPNTGAGGANVWEHAHFVEYLMPGPGSLYEPLPKGAGLRVSIRRSLRVGNRAGTPVEDLGVKPNDVHYMTPADLLNDNVDLKNRAGELLRKMPVRHMGASVLSVTKRKTTLRVTIRGMNRIDVYLNDRPVDSLKPVARSIDVKVAAESPDTDVIELRGFDGDKLVGRYRVTWGEIAYGGPAASGSKARVAGARRRTGRTAPGKDASARTPNAGDDLAAVSEISPTAFGGPALTADARVAAEPWRAAQCLLTLLRQVNARAPGRRKESDGTVGDAAHRERTSDHNPWVRDGAMGIVTACDITHDPAGGCDAAKLAESIRTSRDSRIKYVIWNRQIANSASIGGQPPWTWRPYSGSNPHTKHVHISVKPEKALYDSAAAWAI
ncbi:MAG TPA: S41 family peptidase [Gemmatimonadaceae bacterium]